MNRLISNLGAILLSLILAITVWVVAVQDENPVITADLDTPVRVTLREPDAGLSIVGQPLEQAVLRLRATRQVWQETLRPQDFVVEADLAGLGPGSHDAPLMASYPGEEVEIVEIRPSSLVVNLEAIATRRVSVRVEILDQPAFGYEWRRATVTPTAVTITGPATLVDQIDSAVVEVALQGARATVERFQPVTLRTAHNERISLASAPGASNSYEIAPRSVQVVVPISQRPGYRDFSVRVPYIGMPASGYQITGIIVDPSLVTLRGNPDAFDSLPGYVETLPIDINDAVDNVDAQLALNLPESLAAVGPQSVSVRVEVDPILGSRLFQVEPIIRGLGLGLTRTVQLRTVDVLVRGPTPLLNTLESSPIQVLLDLTGLEPGTHSVPFEPVVSDGVTVVSLLPQSVDITIAAIATATPEVTPTPAASVSPPASVQPAATPTTGP